MLPKRIKGASQRERKKMATSYGALTTTLSAQITALYNSEVTEFDTLDTQERYSNAWYQTRRNIVEIRGMREQLIRRWNLLVVPDGEDANPLPIAPPELFNRSLDDAVEGAGI